jgi:hypothetical protein
MNPLQFVIAAALTVAVVSAQSSSPPPSTNENITVTADQLQAILADIKTMAATDADIAAVFDGVDLDALLKLTPEQARTALNEKVFDATAPPKRESSRAGSGSRAGTSPSPSPENVGSQSPARPTVPAPAPKSGAVSSLATATATTLAAGVVVTVFTL